MSNVYEDQVFQGIDLLKEPLSSNQYEYCRFEHCNFAGADLSHFRFVGCTFQDCDLSNAKLISATLNDLRFHQCKLLGLHFEDCSDYLFTVSFSHCLVNFSSFYKRQLKKTIFTNSILQEVDFTDADLSGSVFENCDLSRAVFEHTNLEKTDFRTAYHYSIDPEKNRLKKAKFDRMGLSGLLGKYDLQIY